MLCQLLSGVLTDITRADPGQQVGATNTLWVARCTRSLRGRLGEWAVEFQGAQPHADHIVDMILEQLCEADYSDAVRILQSRIAELHRGLGQVVGGDGVYQMEPLGLDLDADPYGVWPDPCAIAQAADE